MYCKLYFQVFDAGPKLTQVYLLKRSEKSCSGNLDNSTELCQNALFREESAPGRIDFSKDLLGQYKSLDL